MRTLFSILMLSAFAAVPAVWAQDQEQTQDDMMAKTETTEAEVTRGYLQNEVVGIKPQVGVIAFQDALGNDTSRLAGGIGLEWNLSSLFGPEIKRSMFIGPSTGAIYSHLGAPGSDFVGSAPANVGTGASSNLLIIPANLKIGYNFGERFRVSAHGGGNVIYRTVANSMALGPSSGGTDTVWRLFPNAGADVEFAVAKKLAILLRPDVTFTPGNEVFTGTLAIGIPIG